MSTPCPPPFSFQYVNFSPPNSRIVYIPSTTCMNVVPVDYYPFLTSPDPCAISLNTRQCLIQGSTITLSPSNPPSSLCFSMTDSLYWDDIAFFLSMCVWNWEICPWFPWATTCRMPQGYFPSTHPWFRYKLRVHIVTIIMPPPFVLLLDPCSISGCRLPDWWDLWISRRVPGNLLSSDIPRPLLSPPHIRVFFLWVTLCVTSWSMFWSCPIRFLYSI